MSQYPSPYQPPPYFQPPYQPPAMDFSQYAPVGHGDLLGPARRASVLQGVLGGLTLVCGILIGAMPYIANVEEMFAQSGTQIPELPPGWTLEQIMRVAFGMFGGCGFVMGLALLVLCFFVRKGSRAAVTMSLVLTGLFLLLLAIRGIVELVQLGSNPMAMAFELFLTAVMIGAFGLNMTWLVAAARNGPLQAMAQQQYLAQFYQMQQQQQAYAQGGYGSPYAPQQQAYGHPAPGTPQAPASSPSPTMPSEKSDDPPPMC